MKTINVSIVLSTFIFIGLQQAKAQTNKHENKQEVKVKEVEHIESAPIKEAEIKTEPKEAKSVLEHQEATPVKEQEIKTETQSTTNTSAENNVAKETPTATNTPKTSFPKNITVKRAVMPVKPIIKDMPQK